MADAASNYLENKILDHVLGKGARNMTSPANLYVSLHTADPTDTMAAAGEVSGNNYSRQSVSFGAASGGTASNLADLVFSCIGGNWGTITHVGIWDASTSGNGLYYGALAASKVINNGDDFKIQADSLVVGAQ